MLHLKFHPDVATEVSTSFQWYEKQTSGLGVDFIAELEMAYTAIIELPVSHYFITLFGDIY